MVPVLVGFDQIEENVPLVTLWCAVIGLKDLPSLSNAASWSPSLRIGLIVTIVYTSSASILSYSACVPTKRM